MPGEAGVGEADQLTVRVADVGDTQDLGVIRQQVFLDDVDLQFPEPAAEFDVARVRERLAAEHDHDVVVENRLDFAELPLVHVAGEVERDFRPKRRAAVLDR